MRKWNDGFTLVELLAVIVILSIVLLIAVPGTIALVQKTRVNAFLYSADGLARAVYMKSYEKNVAPIRYVLQDGKLSESLEIDGLLDGNGFVEVDVHHNVRLFIANKKYCVKKEFADVKVSLHSLDVCDKNLDKPNLDFTNSSVPKVDSSMIPVVYDGKRWIKADLTNTNKNYQWYDYGSKQWANIAVIKTTVKNKYKELELGKAIDEKDVLGYFVWIPNFSYQLTSGTGERAFQVDFSDTVPSGFKEHPAFFWGEKRLTGFWMGKYEVSGSLDQMTVVPEKNPLKSTKLNDFYNSLLDLNKIKKLDQSNNILSEIHLIKNTEWGAVTILSQSEYGRCKDGICTPVGKNKSWITGRSISTAHYNTLEGMDASTTGNITGVYDMNGCSWEFTLGTSSVETLDPSMTREFYDDYSSGHGIMGDLTTEDGTSGWYGTNANFVQKFKPFVIRGGDVNTTNSGIFWYDVDSNSGGFRNGFRIAYIVDGSTFEK